MIWHEAVGMKVGGEAIQRDLEVPQEGVVFGGVKENGLTEGSGKSFNARFAGHGGRL